MRYRGKIMVLKITTSLLVMVSVVRDIKNNRTPDKLGVVNLYTLCIYN